MTCTHDRYRADGFMMDANALKAIKAKSDVCWMSSIIKTCADCGEDISHARRVQVKTVPEILGEL